MRRINFILGYVVREKKFYKNCTRHSISNLFDTTWLISFQLHGWTPEEAVKLIQEKRPHIWLRDKQYDSIEQYYKTCRNEKPRSGG